MILNCTLLRIDKAKPATPMGQVSYEQGRSIELRCTIDAPNTIQRYLIGQWEIQATAVLHVSSSSLKAIGVKPEAGDRVLLKQDGEEQTAIYRIEKPAPRLKSSGLSNWQLFVRSE